MSNAVSCSRCHAVVSQSDTEFSNNGTLLCLRCATVGHAHAHIDRMRDDVYARTRVTSVGRVDVIRGGGMAERARADEEALRLHSDLSSAAGVASPAPAELLCSRCGTAAPSDKMTYSLEGKLMCRACAAAYDERAERRKLEGTVTAGFLLGFFLSVVGVWIVWNRDKPAENKGLWFGFAAGTVVLYLPAVIALLAKFY
jgi:hypothetical protein